MKLDRLIKKIRRWFKATISFVPNYYSDYENAYYEGSSEGYEEGRQDGWNEGKSEGKVAWRDLYDFLQKRGYIDKDEEITTFDMFEQLYRFEYDLKQTIKFWQEKANAGNKDNL